MKIEDVRVFRVSGTYTGPEFPPGSRQSQPRDIYPEFNAIERGSGRRDRISAKYLEIVSDEGVSGIFGPIEDPQIFVILKQLRPFLIGRDPLANELLLDQMIRLDRHGRSGMFMTGVSPVDCALWDLKGKVFDQPSSWWSYSSCGSRIRKYAGLLDRTRSCRCCCCRIPGERVYGPKVVLPSWTRGR